MAAVVLALASAALFGAMTVTLRTALRRGVPADVTAFLMVLIAVYLYFMVVDWLTAMYQGTSHDSQLTRAMITGQYAPLYWLSVVSLAIPLALLFGQFVMRRHSLALLVLSGLLVNVAAIGKRFLLVVPSQLQGSLLPYPSGTYTPTWVEYSVIGGLLALGTLVYIAFMKIFPIIELTTAEGDH